MGNERLLWSRDIRFVRRLAARLDDGRVLELETGVVLIGPADQLTESLANDDRRAAPTGPSTASSRSTPRSPSATAT